MSLSKKSEVSETILKNKISYKDKIALFSKIRHEIKKKDFY